jgi:hypothetical protein
VRLRASIRTDGWTGRTQDDGTIFFRRSLWDVSDGDIWRWRAACGALRDIDEGNA